MFLELGFKLVDPFFKVIDMGSVVSRDLFYEYLIVIDCVSLEVIYKGKT